MRHLNNNNKKEYYNNSKKVPRKTKTTTSRAVLSVIVGVAVGSMMIFSVSPIATIIEGEGQQQTLPAASAQPMDNTSTTTTTTTNTILNSTRHILNTTVPGETVVYRGIISSETQTHLVLPPGEEAHGVGILSHRPDGAVYTGVLTFSATEPVEVGFGHRLHIDNATLSQLDADERFADLFIGRHVQNPELAPNPGLITVGSVIVPDYGTQAPYFSASIPFVADSVWLRTPHGEPFIVVYEVVAEIIQPEAVVVDIE